MRTRYRRLIYTEQHLSHISLGESCSHSPSHVYMINTTYLYCVGRKFRVQNIFRIWKRRRNINKTKVDAEKLKPQYGENKSDSVQTSDAFWRSAIVLVSEWSFLMLFCSNSARTSHFSEIQLVCVRPMDEWAKERRRKKRD